MITRLPSVLYVACLPNSVSISLPVSSTSPFLKSVILASVPVPKYFGIVFPPSSFAKTFSSNPRAFANSTLEKSISNSALSPYLYDEIESPSGSSKSEITAPPFSQAILSCPYTISPDDPCANSIGYPFIAIEPDKPRPFFVPVLVVTVVAPE